MRCQRMSNDTVKPFYVAFAARPCRPYTPTSSHVFEFIVQNGPRSCLLRV